MVGLFADSNSYAGFLINYPIHQGPHPVERRVRRVRKKRLFGSGHTVAAKCGSARCNFSGVLIPCLAFLGHFSFGWWGWSRPVFFHLITPEQKARHHGDCCLAQPSKYIGYYLIGYRVFLINNSIVLAEALEIIII